ncbi:hypothetical protein ACRS5S_00705 [Nocardia asiatica]|uniref:hypothetical protein n=1 Tax=Nocardia asiatica TaxID=209252 RepID=UPI003EDF08EC
MMAPSEARDARLAPTRSGPGLASEAAVVWPDPSPLDAWWRRIMYPDPQHRDAA